MIERIKRIVKHPMVGVVTGVLLMLSGLGEVVEGLSELSELEFGSHHGVLLLGFVTLCKALVELVEGAEKVERSAER